jgi:hypothetical protein
MVIYVNSLFSNNIGVVQKLIAITMEAYIVLYVDMHQQTNI